jgi:hypothetical protein
MLFRIAPGLTGLCIWLQIATELPRGIRIAEVEVELQRAPGIHFELLEPPSRDEELSYIFPGGFKVERTQVLNHRIPGLLYANQPWEGFFACVSMQRLTVEVGYHAKARSAIWDDFREVGVARLQMVLEPHEYGRRQLSRTTGYATGVKNETCNPKGAIVAMLRRPLGPSHRAARRPDGTSGA